MKGRTVAAQAQDPSQTKRTALVVEDDPALRRLVRHLLEGRGMEVAEVDGGRAAILHVAVHQPPDLVCLDLMLPELSGYEVCEYMRSEAKLRAVPILIMSARALPQDRAYAEQVGATSYLVKPFRREAFHAAVDELLNGGPAEEGHP
ncbi:MAG TPA: response regulator [Myxococcaceae bacterium]|jgi:two-component system chemotaxis response regulator CheY|nr:response regulator [Myxococcaceae bacterium]